MMKSILSAGALLIAAASSFAQTDSTAKVHQTFKLGAQGEFVVYHERKPGWGGHEDLAIDAYSVMFIPPNGKPTHVFQFELMDPNGLGRHFHLVTADVNGNEAIVVFNSGGHCYAAITRPVEGKPVIIAPTPLPPPPPSTQPWPPPLPPADPQIIGVEADKATIAARLGHTSVLVTNRDGTKGYTLQDIDGCLRWNPEP